VARRAPQLLTAAMAQFLSDEWLDAVRAAAGTGSLGLDVRLEVVAGDTKFSAVVVDAPTVAFMQGRMKTAGDPGKLLELLRSTAGPGYEAFRDAVAATTTFS